VGLDGSGGSRRALATGRELADRLSLKLRVIVAAGEAHSEGPGSWGDELGAKLPVTEDPRAPVDALVHASTSAGLLILGSRHLRGAAAASSVSQRVAHGASCPVLIVR
jgi:hypothetical protein